jgi:hypothetical protein
MRLSLRVMEKKPHESAGQYKEVPSPVARGTN